MNKRLKEFIKKHIDHQDFEIKIKQIQVGYGMHESTTNKLEPSCKHPAAKAVLYYEDDTETKIVYY